MGENTSPKQISGYGVQCIVYRHQLICVGLHELSPYYIHQRRSVIADYSLHHVGDHVCRIHRDSRGGLLLRRVR